MHTSVFVNDLAESLAFYTEHLGLELLGGPHHNPANANMAFVGASWDAYIELVYDLEHHSPYSLGTRVEHLAFEVDDLDVLLPLLRLHGVAVTRGPLRNPARIRRIAFNEDPNGIAIELLERFQADEEFIVITESTASFTQEHHIDDKARLSIALAVGQWLRGPQVTICARDDLLELGVTSHEFEARRRASSADPTLGAILRPAVTMIMTRGRLSYRDLRRLRPFTSDALRREIAVAAAQADTKPGKCRIRPPSLG